MTLVLNVAFVPDAGQQPVYFHGVSGTVQKSIGQVGRFRRPSSDGAGYYVSGSDVRPSQLDLWAAFATSSAAIAFIDAMNLLVPNKTTKPICSYYKSTPSSDLPIKVIVTSAEVTSMTACKGSELTSGVFARFRVEARLMVEYLP